MQHKYHPIYQLPYCCVPATLQMIFCRRSLDLGDQIRIGAELGLRIPQKLASYFSASKVIILPDDAPEFGTQIFEEKYSIQNFFDRYKYPLQISTQHTFSDTSKLKDFIISNLNNSNDLILRFHNSIVKKEDEPSSGHFALIANLNQEDGEVIISDPEPPFTKRFTAERILYAISDRIDGEKRGIFLVK